MNLGKVLFLNKKLLIYLLKWIVLLKVIGKK